MHRALQPLRSRRGAALILTLMITIAIAAMAMGAIMLSSGAQLTTKFSARQAAFQAAADGGLGILRDSVNRGIFDTLLPANSYKTLALNQPITNALGQTLPGGITRSLYIGRTGGRTGGSATAGQYGSNFASALSVISDVRGAVAARRLLLTQESWAKFAVAINNWSGSAVYGLNEEIHGPFHSNTGLLLQGGCSAGVNGTLFTGPATVVTTISNQSCGRFQRGVKTGASTIPWPTAARVNLMRQYAQDADAANGDYDITSPKSTTGTKNPAVRIEFLTIDVNSNGTIEWDEGFMRVWKAANLSDTTLAFATGRRWPTLPTGIAGATLTSDPNVGSRTCGAVFKVLTADPADSLRFHTAQQIWARTPVSGNNQRDSVRKALASGTRRCYLGGDPHIWSKATGDSLTPDSATVTMTLANGQQGWWVKRRSGAFASIATKRSGDASYLIPLGGNPNFKGVVFVTGDVAISGRLAGRVSVFSTGNIVMADDLVYTNPPGTKCDATGDIFGAIATTDVVIENNSLQTPFKVNNNNFGGFDDTNDANYNMFFLAVGNGTNTGNWYGEGVFYTVDPNPTSGYFGGGTNDASFTSQTCGTALNGCVRVTGGLAQGRVDGATYWGANNYGWAEAHSYDACGAVNPPPYFPTTGRFIESRYYELDPVWLRAIGIETYFSRLRAQ